MGNSHSGNFRTEKLSPQQRIDIVNLIKAGAPKARVAKLYDISRSYVYALLTPKKKKSK